MSSYATLQNLKDRLGSSTSPLGMYQRLTDRVNMTTANDAVGQELVDGAEAYINSELAARYLTPINPALDATLAAWLRYTTVEISAFDAYAKHPLLAAKVPADLKAERDRLVDLLRRIAQGGPGLPGAVEPPGVSTGTKVGQVFGSDRILTDGAVGGLL